MRVKAKKKNISKRNARSWRKGIDITDVEDFLEDQRLDERLGKPLEFKTNDELFEVDEAPAIKKKTIISLKEKRKNLLEKPLKCFAALDNTSKVEDPIKKRNRVRTPEERKVTNLKKKNRKEKGIMTAKEKSAFKQKMKSYKEMEDKLKNKNIKIFANDLWEEKERVKPILINEWFNNAVVKHTLRNTGEPLLTVPLTIHDKRSKLPAIELPHPGTSYNPTLEHHNELMQKVLEKENAIIKKEEHLDRVVTKMIKKKSVKKLDYQMLKEMSSGLEINNDSDNEENDNKEAVEYKPINAPAKNKKKSKKTRVNIRNEKDFKMAIRKAKIEKKKFSDIQRIKLLKNSIAKKETEIISFNKHKKEKKIKKKFLPKTIGRLPFSEPEIDIVLPDKMSGNLRNLIPEGQVLHDRFKSLQKRNILPPNVNIGLAPRGKVKRFVRKTHKIAPQQPIRKKNKK